MKIGLLGGSFNPAHRGHIYISQQAKELCNLDEVWWLVSPQNPFKSTIDTKAFEERFEQAKQLTSTSSFIKIKDYEKKKNLNRTFDSLTYIKKDYPKHSFCWLMGADNLNEFHKWYKWEEIFNLLPLVVINRRVKDNPLDSLAAKEFKEFRVRDGELIFSSSLPCWFYGEVEAYDMSSTEIRGGDVFWFKGKEK